MRKWIAVTAFVCAACSGSTTAPNSTDAAKFTMTVAVCDVNEGNANPEAKCASTRQAISVGETVLMLNVGARYQLQLYAQHEGRVNCQIFGSISTNPNLTKSVATFNTTEALFAPQPSPLYLAGLRFAAQGPAAYTFSVIATDSCDVPAGTLSPPKIVNTVFE